MQILEDAQRIADKCVNPDDRAAILKAVADLQSMTDALSELREQGLVRRSCRDRCHGLRMSQFEIAIRSMILCQSAAMTPPVNLSFSFLSRVSRHLIDFIAIVSIVVSTIAVFRLVENLIPLLCIASLRLYTDQTAISKCDNLKTVTSSFH